MTTNSDILDASHRIPAKILICASVGLLAAAVILSTLRHRIERTKDFKRADRRVDKGLRETFPASDPRAPHYVDIPVNRR